MRPRRPNYYAILGVSRDASYDQIKAAYRARSRVAHPDRAGTAGEDQQKLLNEAWGVLSDKDKRQAYDLAAMPITDAIREAAASHAGSVVDAAAEMACETLNRSIPSGWGKFGEALRRGGAEVLQAGAQELRQRAAGRRS